MKRLLSALTILLATTFIISAQTKKVQIRKHFGYVENFGTGDNEKGGQSLEFNKSLLDSTSLVFTVVSGKCEGITVVCKNKYDVWVTVIDKGQPNVIFKYDQYFSRYNQDSSFKSFIITVNGSHNYYSNQACKVKVDLIKYVNIDSTMFETKYETNGKIEYNTVATDGVSYLELYLNYPGNKSVRVTNPKFGNIRGKNFNNSDEHSFNVPLDESGYATIRYYPPKYISQKNWDKYSESKQVKRDQNNYDYQYKKTIPVALVVTYSNHKDKYVTDTVIVNVCRTPIFFIHGFLGTAGTWSKMSGNLGNKGYFTFTHNYHAGAGSIEDQSRLLKQNIQEYFDKVAIKVKKVDLICHSMGGLIARQYVQSRIYDNNVRKLITVGTPHHGVGNDDNFYDWIGYWAGKQGASWYNTHKIGIQQLKENSSFLKRLNSGEASGTHLVKGIQFGNIYTVPWDYVVWSNSAHLNMVASYVLYDVPHSSDLSSGFALTDHPDVEKQILHWLETDIKQERNIMVYPELSKASKGEVYRGYFKGDDFVEEQIKTFPLKFSLTDAIITKEGTAIIHLKAGNVIWGSIFLEENSEIYIQNCSPHQMEIRMFRGKAIFKSTKSDGSHFIVSLHNRNYGIMKDGVHVFSPLAYIRGLDTEFAIENSDEIKIYGLEGKMEISTDINPGYKPVVISNKQAVVVSGKKIEETKFKKPDWCIDLDEIIKEDDGINEDDINEDANPDKTKKSASQSVSEDSSDMLIGFIIIGIGAVFIIIVIVVIVILIIRKKRKNNENKTFNSN
ncbi:MAG TPA: alpha/beta fold hydrolase [Bacteroidales bacterium]|nr:alpha/beta fold hydrolase [Bacteroidales bacterium]